MNGLRILLALTFFALLRTGIAQPLNDNCADAISIIVGATCEPSSYSTFGATTETILPNPSCGFYSGSDVWFTFIVPASGQFRVEITSITSGSVFYQLYSGTCAQFTAIQCSGAGANFNNSLLAGQSVYLRAYRQNSIAGMEFTLCVWEPEIPENDNCIDAISILVESSCNPQNFSCIFSTAESNAIAPAPTCGFYSGGDVWFTFEVPASGGFRIETTALSVGSVSYQLYSGLCGSFTNVACAGGNTNFNNPIMGGQTLYLRVFRYADVQGLDFSLCIYDIPVHSNDNCAGAMNLIVGSSCIMQTFSSVFQTTETGIAPGPGCIGYSGGDVWFKFIVPESGKLRVERNNIEGINAQFALYTGTCGSFTNLACAQLTNALNVNNSSLGGEEIYLRVYNYGSDVGGTFELCVWEPPTPDNDMCSEAIHLPVGLFCQMQTFSNAYCTTEPGVAPNPGCIGYSGGDVWFTFDMPESGQIRIERNNLINVNAQWAVYQGTCGNMTNVTCAQLVNQLNINNPSLAGETLYLRVYNYGSVQGGTFEICIWETAIPANDFCANAFALEVGESCVMEQFTNANCTAEAGVNPSTDCLGYSGGDVWFTLQVPASGRLRLDRNNLFNINAQMALYQGDCAGFTEVACAQLTDVLLIQDSTLAGETLYLRVFNYGSPQGGVFELCATEADCNGDAEGTAYYDGCGTCVGGNTTLDPCEQDCNGVFGGAAYLDDCEACVGGNTGLEPCGDPCEGLVGDIAANPIIITSFPYSDIQNTATCFTNQYAITFGSSDVFYQLTTGPNTTGLIIDLCNAGTDFDTYLYFVDATGSATLFDNDDSPFGGNCSYLNVSVNAGTTYYIVVEGFMSSDVGFYELSVEEVLMPQDCNGDFGGTAFIDDCDTCVGGNTGLEPCVNEIPLTQLQVQFCDGTYDFVNVVQCYSIPGAQDYRWELTPVGGSPLPEYTRSYANRNLRIGWVQGIALDETYEVRVKVKVGGEWGNYGPMCLINTGELTPPSQLVANYSPNNPTTGMPYVLCNNLVADYIYQAQMFEWELTGPNTLIAQSLSYFIQLASIPGIQMNTIYQVRVRVLVDGQWGAFGVQLPIQIGNPANTQIIASQCGTTRALNQAVAAINTCGATSYTFRFQHETEAERIVVRTAYTCPLWQVQAPLTPGETYHASVKVSQGGVNGDYSTACDITIAGPQAAGFANDLLMVKSISESTLGIYPNPNAGTEVRLELSGIEEGTHDVAITVYNIYGKLMTRDVFGHQGAELSRLVRFEQKLAAGMYLVHVAVDGEIFETGKIIVE